jgi:hypothetical protein
MHSRTRGLRARREGVLELVLYTNDSALIFDGVAHDEFINLFYHIEQIRRNPGLILTGAERCLREDKKGLMNILDTDAPQLLR